MSTVLSVYTTIEVMVSLRQVEKDLSSGYGSHECNASIYSYHRNCVVMQY